MGENLEYHSTPLIDEDDDIPQLSLSTLSALNEFLAEKNEREKRLKQIAQPDGKLLEDVELEEDWVCSITRAGKYSNFIFCYSN